MVDSFTTDDGEHIHVAVSGNGPPMVLMHEWASGHGVWEPIVPKLEQAFTVYRWDARAHGGHPLAGSEAPSVGRMASDLVQMFDHYGLDRPVVVSHSMGALTLWEYIGRHGCGRLGRICIIDQSPKLITGGGWDLGIYGEWPAERDRAFVIEMHASFVETVVKLVAFGKNARARERYDSGSKGMQRLRAYLAGLDPKPLISIWESLADADYRPVLSTIDVPTLLVYGSESNYYGVETGLFVRRSTPGSRLIVYEGADHSPHVAQPGRFADDLMRFCGP